MLRAWLVAGVAAVMSGLLTTNLRKNCAQVRASNSAAHVGTSRPATRPRAAERRVREHADLPLARQREDRRLDFAVVDGVVHADEIERLVAHERYELVVLRLERGGQADVADAALLLQLPEEAELGGDSPRLCT